MIRFSDEVWQCTAALREAIHGLPFNTELAAGSLSRERFRTYIIQDAIYIGQFSRALAISAAKAPDTATMQSAQCLPRSVTCTRTRLALPPTMRTFPCARLPKHFD